MVETINIYCDESCHLEQDGINSMVTGALWCPLEKTRNIAVRIREIKSKHHLDEDFEIKWTKVSPGKVQFYLDLLDYFFDDDDLHFRALVVEDKSKLRHEDFGQDHDTFYYKMYFYTLRYLLKPKTCFRIYLDIKDTHSGQKIEKLHDVLCNQLYDFQKKIIQRVQTVRSHEIEQLQLCDLLTGIVSYANRKDLADKDRSSAKVALMKRMQERSSYSLIRTTVLGETKVNLLIWEARELQA